MIRRSSLWIGSVLLLTSLTGYAGGPPILTTSKVPEYFVVGRPETLVFVVRFFGGGQPMVRKDFRVRATGGRASKIDVSAIPTGNGGEYAATLTLPAPGDWTIRVDLVGEISLNLNEESRMSQPLQRKAIWLGSPLPDSLSLEARGERNFLEKGCITCHVHRAFVTPKYIAGWRLPLRWYPELTGRKFFYDYLVQLLANPSSVRDGARMPNLNLAKDDISALVAFINREDQR